MKSVKFEFHGVQELLVPDDELAVACAREIVEGACYPFCTEVRRPVKCVVDLGAHAGEFTVMAALHWPEATIHAFEPNPMVHQFLYYNTKRFPQIKVNHQAVSGVAGRQKLFFNTLGSVAGSLYPGVDRDGNPAEAGIDVDVVGPETIAAIKPNVLKLDIEGAEIPVLQGLNEMAAISRIERLYIEFHNERGRQLIEKILLPTHELAWARIFRAQQGEVMYTRRVE